MRCFSASCRWAMTLVALGPIPVLRGFGTKGTVDVVATLVDGVRAGPEEAGRVNTFISFRILARRLLPGVDNAEDLPGGGLLSASDDVGVGNVGAEDDENEDVADDVEKA
jgi:hypothetical protein